MSLLSSAAQAASLIASPFVYKPRGRGVSSLVQDSTTARASSWTARFCARATSQRIWSAMATSVPKRSARTPRACSTTASRACTFLELDPIEARPPFLEFGLVLRKAESWPRGSSLTGPRPDETSSLEARRWGRRGAQMCGMAGMSDEQIRAASVDGTPPQYLEIVVADYDPEWPRWFERAAEGIRSALGEAALEIHHVGSTSVPLLAAKPLIDINLVVADTTDE